MPGRPRLQLLILVVTLAATAFTLAACGGDDGAGDTASTGDGATTADAAEGCRAVQQPEPRRVKERKRPSFRLARDKTYSAKIETSCGDFTIRLDSQRAPRTGGSFVTLARDDFYDGLSFHRIVPGFVIQGGDPNGDGTGDAGYKVRERPPSDIVYSEGVVAMAKGGAEPGGTSGSQFFVVTATDSGLEPDYALLGEVTSGLDVVQIIGRVPTNADQPLAPVVIDDVKIEVK